MSDRICIVREGRVVQIGSPRDLYDRPRNDRPQSRYVAGFVGTSNFFDSKVSAVTADLTSVTLANGMVLNRVFLGEHTESLVRHESLGEFLILPPTIRIERRAVQYGRYSVRHLECWRSPRSGP